jgi:hypothetical protein
MTVQHPAPDILVYKRRGENHPLAIRDEAQTIERFVPIGPGDALIVNYDWYRSSPAERESRRETARQTYFPYSRVQGAENGGVKAKVGCNNEDPRTQKFCGDGSLGMIGRRR